MSGSNDRHTVSQPMRTHATTTGLTPHPTRNDAIRPMTGRVVQAELAGSPVAIVAVDGGSPRADPITRAEFAVRVLLQLEEIVLGGEATGARAGADAELAVDGAQVGVHRADAEVELRGGLSV
jgi:hypothetical protein